MPDLDVTSILDAVVSHAMALGVFDSVNSHEPKSPPGRGVTCAVWVDAIDPVLSSGLSVTSARLAMQVRTYQSALQQPYDAIDPNMVAAVSLLFNAYIGDFTLGDLIREVDVRGSNGPGLSGRAGYIDQGGQLNRVFTITLPLIVNDVWTEVA